MSRFMLGCGACALVLAWPLAAPAQPRDVIDTDGPDFVESTEVVGRGRWQFETGPYVQDDLRHDTVHRLISTPLLLKFGTSDEFEVRLETDGRVWASSFTPAGSSISGLHSTADTAIGVKWHSHDRQPGQGAPAIAWIAHVEIPSGSRNERGSGLRPSLRSVIGLDLPYNLSLGLMPGIKLETQPDGRRFTSGILGVVLGKWWSDRFRTFLESSAIQIAHQQSGGVILYNDIGAAYLLTNSWQVGARAGWAANRNTPSRYVLVSIAARF